MPPGARIHNIDGGRHGACYTRNKEYPPNIEVLTPREGSLPGPAGPGRHEGRVGP